MIFPILRGFVGWREAPLTWALVLLCFGVFLFSSSPGRQESVIRGIFQDKEYLITQGLQFAHFIEDSRGQGTPLMREVASLGRRGHRDPLMTLGLMAFRSPAFLANAPNLPSYGDELARQRWLERLSQFQEAQKEQASQGLGLISATSGWPRWITYQFSHASWTHLIINGLFLVIFGCALEIMLGPLVVLGTFLISGLLSGGVFLFLSGGSGVPLVGASGAVSGLMAVTCLLLWRRPVPFLYLLFIPRKGFSGIVYLPAWVAFVLWLASDLAGHLSTVREIGGIAYSAHLGGHLAGVLLVLIWAVLRAVGGYSVFPHETTMPASRPIGTRHEL